MELDTSNEKGSYYHMVDKFTNSELEIVGETSHYPVGTYSESRMGSTQAG